LADVLERIAARPPARDLQAVQAVWAAVAGEELAANSRPAVLHGQRLLVYVSAPAWVHRLHFSGADLRLRLNAALGREVVAVLRFRVGPVGAPRAGVAPC
jgi:predicted nucleic acid-binding Zn ribbon protein